MDDFFNKESCDRCSSPLKGGRTMSWFTEETLCMECVKKEKELKSKLRESGDNDNYVGCGYIPTVRSKRP